MQHYISLHAQIREQNQNCMWLITVDTGDRTENMKMWPKTQQSTRHPQKKKVKTRVIPKLEIRQPETWVDGC